MTITGPWKSFAVGCVVSICAMSTAHAGWDYDDGPSSGYKRREKEFSFKNRKGEESTVGLRYEFQEGRGGRPGTYRVTVKDVSDNVDIDTTVYVEANEGADLDLTAVKAALEKKFSGFGQERNRADGAKFLSLLDQDSGPVAELHDSVVNEYALKGSAEAPVQTVTSNSDELARLKREKVRKCLRGRESSAACKEVSDKIAALEASDRRIREDAAAETAAAKADFETVRAENDVTTEKIDFSKLRCEDSTMTKLSVDARIVGKEKGGMFDRTNEFTGVSETCAKGYVFCFGENVSCKYTSENYEIPFTDRVSCVLTAQEAKNGCNATLCAKKWGKMAKQEGSSVRDALKANTSGMTPRSGVAR